MTDNKHLITPPPELVQQLADGARTWLDAITDAYRAGADHELEACCEWLGDDDDRATLRAARRPKPSSLKGQSLELIDLIQGNTKSWDIRDLDVVRRALQQLPD